MSPPVRATLIDLLQQAFSNGEHSLRAVALAIGCSAGHLSRVVRGLRRPSRKLVLDLQRHLSRSDLERLHRERKRGRRARRTLCKSVRRAFHVKNRLRLVSSLRQAFALVCWCPAGQALVDALDRRAGVDFKAAKWLARLLNAPEQAVLLRVLLGGSAIQEMRPRDVGFPVAVVESPGAWWLAVATQLEDYFEVVFCQLELVTPARTYRRVDFLVAAAGEGKVIFRVLEVDGPQHAGSKRADRVRAQEISLRAFRISAEAAYAEDILTKVRNWMRSELKAAPMPAKG